MNNTAENNAPPHEHGLELDGQHYPFTYDTSADSPGTLTSGLYRDAIFAQSACNLSGVLGSIGKFEVGSAIWAEARRIGGKGTDWVNQHPILRLYATQITHLSRMGSTIDSHDEWKACWDYAHHEKRALALAQANAEVKVAIGGLDTGVWPGGEVDLTNEFPGIRWAASGIDAVAWVIEQLAKHNNDDQHKGFELFWDKLLYLNDYGGDEMTVRLNGSRHDGSMINIAWYRGKPLWDNENKLVEGSARMCMQGGLCCRVGRPTDTIDRHTFSVHT